MLVLTNSTDAQGNAYHTSQLLPSAPSIPPPFSLDLLPIPRTTPSRSAAVLFIIYFYTVIPPVPHRLHDSPIVFLSVGGAGMHVQRVLVAIFICSSLKSIDIAFFYR